AYESAGDLRRAIPLMEATLTQCEQILGDTHPDTLTSRNNLATTYQVAGDLGRAIPLLKATLTQCEQILGDTHPHTLTSRNNLAAAYRAAGEPQGDTHPQTLTSRNSLAAARQEFEAVQHGSTATSVTNAEPQQPSTAG
ncbi:tetratricopeptide repeat protein, partial [Streptomyces sp. NPDC047000]|uniref:tetratricopeptide repeat protein n=1 Tax=Streptomyces sp. NPDC047000 TaxID=3155474 RepID=UPI0033F3C5AB